MTPIVLLTTWVLTGLLLHQLINYGLIKLVEQDARRLLDPSDTKYEAMDAEEKRRYLKEMQKYAARLKTWSLLYWTGYLV